MHRLVRGALFVLAGATALATQSIAAHPQASDPDSVRSPANAPLHPGDRLLVKLWLDTTLTDTVRLDETTSAIIPRLGPLPLAGLPASEIADSVRRAYTRVIRTPSIEITPLRRVTVIGEVNKPATYFLETRATLREAVAMAGGMTPIAVVSHVTIVRDTLRIRVKDWARRGGPSTVLHSDDVVWVDREPWIEQNLFSVISGVGVVFSVLYTALHR
jgi:polysaccharide export outer membrane protein